MSTNVPTVISTVAEDVQAAGSDTRPPMLDRTDYDSWAQRIRLYCLGKENGVNILKSIDEGPYRVETTRDILDTNEDGTPVYGMDRPKMYDELDDKDKKRFDADIRASNIVLQGLPKDIYKLINHNTDAKAVWDNVKMLLSGSELTMEDRESQLYDEFEHFKMKPDESVYEYYVRFHKLVNDMRNIRMTMPNIQLNSKFVNNMNPEWHKFVTSVKLTKGLKNTNYEQLYAFLLQNERHAMFEKLILNQFKTNQGETSSSNDSTAFYSNIGITTKASQVIPLGNGNHKLIPDPMFKQADADAHVGNFINQLALLISQNMNSLPQTNNNLRTASNPHNQATVKDGRIVVQPVQERQYDQGRGGAGRGYVGNQNRGRNGNQGQAKPIKCYNCGGEGHIARNCTSPKRPQNADYFRDKMLLVQAQDNGAALDEEDLLFLAEGNAKTYDADVDEQPIQEIGHNHQNAFQVADCDAYDSDVDDGPTAHTIFMASISPMVSPKVSSSPQAGPSKDKLISEVLKLYDDADVQQMHDKVQPTETIESNIENMGNINIVPYDQYVKQSESEVVPSDASSAVNNDYVFDEYTACAPDDSVISELNAYKNVLLFMNNVLNLS